MPLGWAFFGTIELMIEPVIEYPAASPSPLRDLLGSIQLNKPKHKTNKYWLIAEKIAAATNTKPNRWLREVKCYEFACERALNDLKELSPRNPVAYFLWLLKKHKK